MEKMNGLWTKLEKQFYLFTQKWGYIDKPTAKAYKAYNFSIHNLEEQMFIKRLWSICAVEELSEWYHAREDGEDHLKEEACDFFNFVMSGFIAMGYTPKDFNNIIDLEGEWNVDKHEAPVLTEGYLLWLASDAIHYATNKLKNRPWTQSNFKVDLGKFEPRIKKVWEVTWTFIRYNFTSFEDFEKHFNHKIDTNLKRIRSGY